jgi:hypothetical protein
LIEIKARRRRPAISVREVYEFGTGEFVGNRILLGGQSKEHAMRHLYLSTSAIALATALAAAALGYGSAAQAQPYGGWGMMGYGPGYGMMGGYGPGYGMTGYGPGCYGPAMMYGCGYGSGPGPGYGPGYFAGARGNLNLSTDDVKNYFSRWITAQGNSHIKVGDVKVQDPDTIVADIVTQDNSLVQRFVVNRHTGFYRPSEK